MAKRAQRLSETMLPADVKSALDREAFSLPTEPFSLPAEEEMIDVKIIRDSGPTCLVEWTEHDDLWRAYVPKEVIQHLRVSADELAAGTPYGVRWETLIEVRATPTNVANALRRRGIWTSNDLKGRWPEAKTAMWEAVAMDLVGLLRRVEAYEQETKP